MIEDRFKPTREQNIFLTKKLCVQSAYSGMRMKNRNVTFPLMPPAFDQKKAETELIALPFSQKTSTETALNLFAWKARSHFDANSKLFFGNSSHGWNSSG